jgi:DNA-binding GntR family transcriptional regulator
MSAAEVVSLLRTAILEGDLVPGQRLREAEFSVQLGVSRTPIREALRILGAEGYVESTPYAGSRVRSYDAHEIHAAFQARALLEGLAARRAAQRATTGQVERLRESCSRYEAVGVATDRDAAAAIVENNTFHDIVLEASGSSVIADAIRKLVELPRSQQIRVAAAVGEEKRAAEHAHRQLTKAIAAGDADWADMVAQTHVLDRRDRTIEFLSREHLLS